MRRLLFEISYAGTRYHGYQVQPNALSVAETLQDAVEKVFKRRENITGCSRTDTGVHANQFYLHMDTEQRIPVEAAVTALNNTLPDDICVRSCREVPADFHARYSVKWKEYVYCIWNHPVKNPFLNGMAMHYKYPLDAGLMDRCAKEFIGTHDFSGFRSSGAKEGSAVRTIYDASVKREGDMVIFTVAGDGFLYNMVRIMVGTLLLCPMGRLKEGDLSRIIASGDREEGGMTAPAQGLYLNRVSFAPWPEHQ
ncbi:MAG: tRNA pseudouridine(38-40) synthase TruA [Oscillospiraceae bacterium]|nr:tRNA pseudouridine(38-40) synthase TruA [Oscillospiraceae bacterium]